VKVSVVLSAVKVALVADEKVPEASRVIHPLDGVCQVAAVEDVAVNT